MMQQWFGYTAPRVPGSRVHPGGLRHARVRLRRLDLSSRARGTNCADRLPGMMTLISLAITVAFLYSLVVTLGYPGDGPLVGAGDAGHDHAAGPLDRDALDLAGAAARSAN